MARLACEDQRVLGLTCTARCRHAMIGATPCGGGKPGKKEFKVDWVRRNHEGRKSKFKVKVRG